ncbi:hypothetical protein Pint_33257 [Pistacia integerrima]|uniref:Uncharacterized protein n=1 Tax=Pistacia integerrima TaxID=434235 RepID=A0ACC0X4B0_9ROSI|nr:hypothetical protein Pint_33257 [Pistacia integerrima]
MCFYTFLVFCLGFSVFSFKFCVFVFVFLTHFVFSFLFERLM